MGFVDAYALDKIKDFVVVLVVEVAELLEGDDNDMSAGIGAFVTVVGLVLATEIDLIPLASHGRLHMIAEAPHSPVHAHFIVTFFDGLVDETGGYYPQRRSVDLPALQRPVLIPNDSVRFHHNTLAKAHVIRNDAATVRLLLVDLEE